MKYRKANISLRASKSNQNFCVNLTLTKHSIKFSSSNCTDGYLKIYLKGQETVDAYDKFDHELCGNEIPHPVISEGPRLVMVFSSGELQGRGFKVRLLKSGFKYGSFLP